MSKKAMSKKEYAFEVPVQGFVRLYVQAESREEAERLLKDGEYEHDVIAAWSDVELVLDEAELLE
jgi:DNA-dependent RNA polymerase auxiliary subunit epsilon